MQKKLNKSPLAWLVGFAKPHMEGYIASVILVFQNVYLFNDTIENNIKFGKPDATMEEVVAAAKKACCLSQELRYCYR